MKKLAMKKILSKIKKGDYTIECNEECNCSFDWFVASGRLEFEEENTDCWSKNVLVVDGKEIASYDAFNGLVLNAPKKDAEELEELLDELEISNDMHSYGCDYNLVHDAHWRASLADYLKDNKYHTYIYYPRGFNNEYECILVLNYCDSQILIPGDWYEKTAEEWANMYLQRDTDATQYFINLRIIDTLYEIDYSWYDCRDDAAYSHGSPNKYFIDLEEAQEVFADLNPSGNDCYTLQAINFVDGEIAEIDVLEAKYGPEALQAKKERWGE